MGRRCNRGARKIARHLWFQPVRWSGFPDNVTPARFALNLLHLLNQVLVVTIHIIELMSVKSGSSGLKSNRGLEDRRKVSMIWTGGSNGG